MNLPAYLALLFFLLTLILAWRYRRLQNQIAQYTQIIRNQAENIPADFAGLEDISNAVASLQAGYHKRLSDLTFETNRLAAILAQLTDGVLIADATGQVQFANPAAARLFETDTAAGHSVAEVVRNHQFIETWRTSQQTRQMQIAAAELAIHKKFLQLVVIPDQHGGGSLLLVHDQTQARKLEIVRRDFISNISHELRTPLASLKALIETLQDGALDDPQAGPRFLERIATEVDALTHMAQELLDLSRIESGQVELAFAKIFPGQLLASAAERMKMQCERAGLKVSITSANLPDIRADRLRLEQVLVNLIHNAVKFSKPGGEIFLGAQPTPTGIRFAVRDTGVGIPAENLPRIFERFYQADKARAGSGTGLGLSISKHIIEAHGGKIWAESVEGQGSVFYFEIPLA